MRFFTQFKQLADISTPDPHWVLENRSRLLSIVSTDARAHQEAVLASAPVALFTRCSRAFRLAFCYPRLATALAAFVILSFSSAGLSSVAKASVPGNVFYPIKLALEKTGVRLAPNSAMKAKLQIELAGERLAEASNSKKPETVRQALDQFQEQLAAVSSQVDPKRMSGTKPAAAAQIGNLLNKRTKEYKKQLEATAKTLPASEINRVAEINRAVNTSSLAGVELMAASAELGGARSEEVKDAVQETLDNAQKQVFELSVKRVKRQEKRDKVGLAPVVAEEGEMWNAREALEEAKERLEDEDLSGAVSKVKESVEIMNKLPSE